MKQIVAWVPIEKQKQLIDANKNFNIPIIFVESEAEIEFNMDGFVIFYPSFAVDNDNFLTLVNKYPLRTFHPICDFHVMDFKTTMLMESLNDLIPDNPDVANNLLNRFLEMNIK